jgi:vancomycin permeability regulator SanA
MRHTFRLILRILVPLSVCSLLAALLINQAVASAADDRVFSVETVRRAPVAIVPGAAVWADRSLSHVLQDRVDTALELYRRGKVARLLFSGAEDGKYYNEAREMYRYAIERGVPAVSILTDAAGYTTFETIERAVSVFGISNALIVTQEFHLARALYLAARLGIDAAGVPADRRPYVNISFYRFREFFARAKAWFEVRVR